MKNIWSVFIILIFIAPLIEAQPKFSSVNSASGSFSRMGFGARGISMGNSISALNEGNLSAYYNPALSVFQKENYFTSAYSFLSLDRKLNFIGFTRKFEFFSSKDTVTENRIPRATAGLSVGLINAGVTNIDARDNQGFKKDPLSTSENLGFMAFAIKFSNKFSAGLMARFYYYKLYEDVTSTGVGFDLGMLYTLNSEWTFSFVISDLNSKYEWDTSPIYGTSGINTTAKFPVTKKIGTAYKSSNLPLVVSLEYNFDNMKSSIYKFGAEYEVYSNLFLRGGIDNLHINNKDNPIRPSLGFSFTKEFSILKISVDYAFVIEAYSPQDRHITGISILF